MAKLFLDNRITDVVYRINNGDATTDAIKNEISYAINRAAGVLRSDVVRGQYRELDYVEREIQLRFLESAWGRTTIVTRTLYDHFGLSSVSDRPCVVAGEVIRRVMWLDRDLWGRWGEIVSVAGMSDQQVKEAVRTFREEDEHEFNQAAARNALREFGIPQEYKEHMALRAEQRREASREATSRIERRAEARRVEREERELSNRADSMRRAAERLNVRLSREDIDRLAGIATTNDSIRYVPYNIATFNYTPFTAVDVRATS